MRKNFLASLNKRLARENEDITPAGDEPEVVDTPAEGEVPAQEPVVIDAEAPVGDEAPAVVDEPAVIDEPAADAPPADVDVTIDAPNGAEVSVDGGAGEPAVVEVTPEGEATAGLDADAQAEVVGDTAEGDAAAFEVPDVSPETEMAAVAPVGDSAGDTMLADGEELADAGDEVPFAEDAANYAANLGDTIEGQIEQNEVGPEPMMTATAAESLQVMLKRYNIPFKHSISRESFATPGGKLAANKQVLQFAREAEADLRGKIKAIVDQAIAWLKGLWQQLTDKGERVAKKAEGLAARAKEAKLAGGETTVQTTGETSPQYIHALLATAGQMLGAAQNLDGNVGQGKSTVPGFTFEISSGDGRYSVNLNESFQSKDIKSLNSGQITALCSTISQAARAYSKHTSKLKAFVESIKSSTDMNPAELSSRVMAAQKLTAGANKLFYSQLEALLQVVEKSIASGTQAKSAKSEADAAAGAAAA